MPITELYQRRPAELTGMRYHELALQQWLHSNFHVVDGYPVPVVFSTPMDAFSHFKELWGKPEGGNPFAYLLDAKDVDGIPLYEPHPSPARYPLFSVYRRGWKFRSWQNYSIHKWRNLSWPTVTDSPRRGDMANVAQAQMPMAWDYTFQLDFFCLRPDTMATFVKGFMRKLSRAGGIPQTWLMTAYPFYGSMLTRMYLEGDINYMTPEQPPDGSNVEFRVSMNVVIEGFEPDINVQEVPALWDLVLNSQVPSVVAPEILQTIYSQTIELKMPEGTINHNVNLSEGSLANPNINLRLDQNNPNRSFIPDY
jgi:hypothetical protein